MTQQLLHSANIISILQQMCSETVPKGVAACRLRDSGALDRGFHCFLKVFFGYVVTTPLARARVDGNFRGWENVLPSPGAIGVGVFPFERERQINPATAVVQIVLMNFLRALQVELKGVAQTLGQNCDPVA